MKISNLLFVGFMLVALGTNTHLVWGQNSGEDQVQSPDDGDQSDGIAAQVLAPATVMVQRYLVTYMKSNTSGIFDTATAVTVTNLSKVPCEVQIDWHVGFTPNSPSCTTTAMIGPGVTFDFCSRSLPSPITTCNGTCSPQLTFHEGKAMILSELRCPRLGVEARNYYTSNGDNNVEAVSNPNIVQLVGIANRGE